MIRSEVLETVRGLVAQVGPLGETPTEHQPLFYDASRESSDSARSRGEYGLDSLDRVEIAMMVEDEWSLDIPDDEADAANTIGQIADMVMAKLA